MGWNDWPDYTGSLPMPKVLEAELIPDSSSVPLEECLARFWEAGEALDSFVTNPAPPEIETAILKRLGKPPESIGGEDLARLLARAYSVASKAALLAALGERPPKRFGSDSH
jgi:uncharacterized Zn finger protein